MTSFVSQTTLPAKLSDLTKHVNYNLGMILGVDDFTQEFAYLAGRDQWLARDLLGYGTVCGLRVTVEDGGERGPRVLVEPGVALSPLGQLIRVRPAQCAHLNDWLGTHPDEVLSHTSSPPADAITLYITLCYRQCPTDLAPIPGEPCRDESEIRQPSRWQDDFKLELRFTSPDQREETAVRQFVAWLGQVEVTATGGLTLTEFEQMLRQAAVTGSPLDAPFELSFSSPPESIQIPADQVCDYWRAAFRIWVTDLRPLTLGNGCGDPPAEQCLLLAQLDVPLVRELNGAWKVKNLDDIRLNEDQRPYLVHLRLLQEWLACGPARATSTDVITSPPSSPPAPGPGGSGESVSPFESDLTHIVALSWPHAGASLLDIVVDDKPQKGLLIAFGKQTLDDGGAVEVGPGSLDENTLQVLVEESEVVDGADVWAYRGIRPATLLPVAVKSAEAEDGLVTVATEIPGPRATAVAFLLSEAAFKFIQDKKLLIQLKGDFVRDETGKRAIDAEFVRGELPTGDRPREHKLGLQGGRFESWVRVSKIIDLNTATEAELRSLTGIGPTLAKNIISTRDRLGGFRSVDDLRGVRQMRENVLNAIRPFVTVR